MATTTDCDVGELTHQSIVHWFSSPTPRIDCWLFSGFVWCRGLQPARQTWILGGCQRYRFIGTLGIIYTDDLMQSDIFTIPPPTYCFLLRIGRQLKRSWETWHTPGWFVTNKWTLEFLLICLISSILLRTYSINFLHCWIWNWVIEGKRRWGKANKDQQELLKYRYNLIYCKLFL